VSLQPRSTGRPQGIGVLATLAGIAALTACSFGPARQDHFYPLAPTVQVEPLAATPVAATLLVTQPVARGLGVGRELIFVGADHPGEVQTYTYHLWAEPPAAAIASSLVASLRQAQLFAFVVAPGQRAGADYLLSGELTRLTHFPDAEPPRVEAAFNLTLVDASDRRPLTSHLYQGSEPAGPDPAAAAAAFERLVGRLLGDAVRDLQAQRGRLRRSAAL
jgi:cholesterol transport system auxiliary component